MIPKFVGVTGLPIAGSTLQLLAMYPEIKCEGIVAKDKIIGAPLISLHAVPGLPKKVQECLYFLRFEDMLAQPVACMTHLYAWLDLSPFEINPNKLEMGIRESASHYHMKYLHKQSEQIVRPHRHEIPPRIQAQIETANSWFYQLYYPQVK